MSVVAWLRTRGLVIAARCVVLAVGVLSAQFADPIAARADWTENVINRVLGLQFAQECFKEPKYQRHVHVLGVEAGGVTLPDIERSRMLNTLSDKLGSGTRNRITVAPAFQTIAGSQGAFDTDAVIRMARLDEAARNAEVTILLRPLEVTAQETRLEVVMWANDPSSGTGQYTCVRPFNVAVPIVAPVDPRCLDGWSKATAINTAEGYRFFMSFFGDCPQAGEAQAAVTRLDGAACDGAWQQARARGTVDGYRTFVRENPSCTLQVQAANDIIAALANAGGGTSSGGSGGSGSGGGSASSGSNSGGGSSFGAPVAQPPRTRSYHYVGPVNPPDDWLALRTRPSSSSGRRIMKMPEGTPFTVIDRSGAWLQVQLRDGTLGWAHGNWIRCCRELAD
ncbi:MAG: SH3 domain-containing protein [Rhizobiales bacterium]|nr:SH3 domain-containing protein [Hyphomicrobiales bacterium]